MRRNTRLPELLAPAGDFEALLAAVEAGADAIYIGGRSFSARAFAKNFDLDEISLAVKYTHLHGVRLYVTINTLVYDKVNILSVAECLYNIFYRLNIFPTMIQIPNESIFAAAMVGPMGRSKRSADKNPARAQTADRAQERSTTPRKLLISRIAERAGKITSAEISREPTSFIAITIITAVTEAMRIL